MWGWSKNGGRETVVDVSKTLGRPREVVREFQLKVFLAKTSGLVDELGLTDLLAEAPDLVIVLFLRGTRGTLPRRRIGVR